jgi:hypothetical protein
VQFCDRLGVIGSAACLLHCVALPLVLAGAPHAAWLGAAPVEATLLGGCALFGLFAVPSGFRCHRCPHVGFLYLTGLVVLAGGRFAAGDRLEAWLTPAGAALVAGAHVWNGWLRRRGAACR